MKKNRHILLFLTLLLATVSCEERHPQLFGDISGVYFNNRTSGVFSDMRRLTLVYEDGDEIQMPVTVQLLGRPASIDRSIDISVVSDNAVEGVDYRIPEAAVLPAGETSLSYMVTLIRTESIKSEEKELRLELHANDNFALPVQDMVLSSGKIPAVQYRIYFSDMFTAPPAGWDENILGEFSQQKFELIIKVLGIKRSDFNDVERMSLAYQAYIFMEMYRYVNEELAKKEAGEDYDEDIIDKTTGEPLSYEKKKD